MRWSYTLCCTVQKCIILLIKCWFQDLLSGANLEGLTRHFHSTSLMCSLFKSRAIRSSAGLYIMSGSMIVCWPATPFLYLEDKVSTAAFQHHVTKFYFTKLQWFWQQKVSLYWQKIQSPSLSLCVHRSASLYFTLTSRQREPVSCTWMETGTFTQAALHSLEQSYSIS